MPTCETLATKAELRALEERLRREISGKIPQSQRKAIAREGAGIAKAAILPLLAGLATVTDLNSLRRGVGKNRVNISSNTGKINVLGNSMDNLRYKTNRLGLRVGTAQRTASSAKVKTDSLGRVVFDNKRNIGGLKSRFGGLRQKFINLDIRTKGNLGKIVRLTGRVGGIALKVLNIVGTISSIFSIIATLATLAQMRRLSAEVKRLERRTWANSQIIKLLEARYHRLNRELRQIGKVASRAFTRSFEALKEATRAHREAINADRLATKANSRAIKAARDAAIATTVAYAASAAVGAIIPRIGRIGGTANSALRKAEEALRKAGRGGRTINNTRIINRTVRQTINRTIDRTKLIQQKVTYQNINKTVKNYVTKRIQNIDRSVNNSKTFVVNQIKNVVDLTPVLAAVQRVDNKVTLNGANILNNTNILKSNQKEILRNQARLGPPLKGGISGFMQRAWKATHMDKALNALNTLLLLHNAALLSRNLGETLSELTGQALQILGITDENENPINIHGLLTNRLESIARNIVGDAVYKGVSETWHKASRITSAAANLMWSVRSIMDSSQEIAEWTAENTGRIGNALKRFRVVPSDAFPWMSENVNAQSGIRRRFQRVRDGIDNIDDVAGSLQGVLGEVRSVQEEFNEWDDNFTRFKDEVKTLEPKEREDNEPALQQATQRETVSQPPNSIANAQRGQGGSDNGAT